MSKIKQLSQCLVEKYNLSQHDADTFVAEMFSIIRENLAYDGIVKVKGLGTFKLAEMNARESVNVNTGERITIEGRNKISFTPENSVRDRINAPFSAFESIDLAEDIDFSLIDQKYDEESAEPQTELPEIPEPPETTEQPEPLEPLSPATPATPESPESPEVPEEETPIPVVEIVPESPEEETPIPVVEIVPGSPEEEIPVPLVEIVPESPEAPETPETSGEPSSPHRMGDAEGREGLPPSGVEPLLLCNPVCESLIREDLTQNKNILKYLRILLALVIVALLGFGAYCIYNVGRDNGMMYYIQYSAMQESENASEAVDTVVATFNDGDSLVRTESGIPVTAKTKALLDQAAERNAKAKALAEEKAKAEAEKAAKAEAANEAKARAEAAKVKAQADAEAKAKAEAAKAKTASSPAANKTAEVYNNMDARVRTGAYDIVGQETVVTVANGQTLKSISKSYLGAGMECYVEAFNGGITEVKPGDKVKIPKLALKKKNN